MYTIENLYQYLIQDQLPDITDLQFDYDDILARALYHLDKSIEQLFKMKKSFEAMIEFTKAIFKFSFYICIYFDTSYRSTSICDIKKKVRELVEDNFLFEDR